MKKLLLSLGAMTAVVAPVAAVVACGSSSDDSKEKTVQFADAASLKAKINELKYTVADGQGDKFTKLTDVLFADGAKLELVGELKGKMDATKDAGHSNTSELMLIKSGSRVALTNAYTANKFDLGTAYVNTQYTSNPITSFETRWGLTADTLKDANYGIYLQNDGKGNATLQIVEFFETANKIQEGDALVSTDQSKPLLAVTNKNPFEVLMNYDVTVVTDAD